MFNDRSDEIKVAEVVEDPASGGRKVMVVLELPIDGNSGSPMALEQMFSMDKTKALAVREAQKHLSRSAGWSDVSRLQFMKDGEKVDNNCPDPDAVRCAITCIASI